MTEKTAGNDIANTQLYMLPTIPRDSNNQAVRKSKKMSESPPIHLAENSELNSTCIDSYWVAPPL